MLCICVSVALMKAVQVLTQDQQKEGCLPPQFVLCTSVVWFWTTLTYSKPLMYYFYISCCVAFCCSAQPDRSLLLCLCSVFISCSGDLSVTFPLMHHQEGKDDDNSQEIDRQNYSHFLEASDAHGCSAYHQSARAAIGPSDAQFSTVANFGFACKRGTGDLSKQHWVQIFV